MIRGIRAELVVAAGGIMIIGLVLYAIIVARNSFDALLAFENIPDRVALHVISADWGLRAALTGAPGLDAEGEIAAHIQAARALAQALRHGGSTEVGTIVRLNDQPLLTNADALDGKLGEWEELSAQVWAARGTGSDRARFAPSLDALFRQTMEANRVTALSIEEQVARERTALLGYGVGIILLIVALLIAIAWMGVRQRRVVQAKNEELELKVRERTVELAYERNLMRTLLDNVPDYIYAKDTGSRFILANRAVAKLMGAASPAALLGKTDFDFFPREIASKFYDDEQGLIRSRAPVVGIPESYSTADGGQGWVSTTKVPLRDADDHIIGLVGIGRDISEARRVESALEENRARLASVINSTDDIILSIDRELRLTFFNETLRNHAQLGLARSVQPGDPVLELVDPATVPTHLENYARAFAGARRHYETSFPLSGDSTLYFETFLNPIYSDNQVTGLAIVTRNITERKLAEEELRRQKELLQAVFDHIPVMIGVFDARGHLEMINHEWERVLGWSLSDINSRDPLVELYPDPEMQAAARGLMFAPTPGWVDLKTVVRSGVMIDTSWAYAPLSGGMTIAFGQDITRRKEIDRLKNEFISTVSHELRTPLTSIRGSLGLIAGGVAGEVPEQARGMIEIAYKNSERLVILINDILDIEKIESGKMQFKMQLLELMPIVEQAIEANHAFGEQYRVRFEVEQAVPDARVSADGDRLNQVLTNLLSNAAKFSPAGSSVQVSVRRVGSKLRVAVRDHGQGIPPDFCHRIFQKFAQADSSNARQKGGTGLGLSIAKAIVERLGGTIGFETIPGVGSTFYFDLPEAGAAPLPAPVTQEPEPRGRVLICKDNQEVAALLARMLQQAGFDTDIALTAQQSRQLLEQNSLHAHNFDLALLDPTLPDGSAMDLLPLLRLKGAPQIPVVIFSSREELQLPQEVTVSLVKSRTTNAELLETISALIRAESAVTWP